MYPTASILSDYVKMPPKKKLCFYASEVLLKNVHLEDIFIPVN